MTTSTLRYQLPKKAIKTDCPQCGSRYQRTLSRYVDTRTGEVIPAAYGRCDREANCAYHLSPYYKEPSGKSYAYEVYEQWKAYNTISNQTNSHSQRHTDAGNSPETRFSPTAQQIRPATSFASITPVHYIPGEVFLGSMGHYERNQLAKLLRIHFGMNIADELLQRFQIGTSSRWPGACVFWYIDEHGRKRGGQIKLFSKDWHTVKYIDQEGKKRTKTSWVHSALLRRYHQRRMPVPDWLIEYDQKAERSPCLFGLPQLFTAPVDIPVAIVEAPKTAILCTPYFSRFIWLAVGALSYLKAERLVPVRDRHIVLFPDLSKNGSAFARWSLIADQLRQEGFSITVSDFLEKRPTTDQQKEAGYDLADWLLDEWSGYPAFWDEQAPANAALTNSSSTKASLH